MTYHIFVYGTLKRGGRLHEHVSEQTYLGPAVLYGFGMRSVHDIYPAITPHPKRWVYGEVYRVDRSPLRTLKQLDVVEGVDRGLYRRIQANVRLDHTGEQLLCFTYEWIRNDGSLVGPWLHTWDVTAKK